MWRPGHRGARTLVLADPHFGKAAAFRSLGIPVPAGSTAAALQRLSAALTRTRAARLIILGDFFHARHGRADRTLATIASWRESWPALDIVLVRGNHDVAAGDPPAAWRVQCVPEPWSAGPLDFRHTPASETVDDFRHTPLPPWEGSGEDRGGGGGGGDDPLTPLPSREGLGEGQDPACARPTLAGHLHPTVTLSDALGTTLRAPCFLFRDYLALLPAFGAFTGGRSARPRPGNRVFAVAEDAVVEVPS